jgi:hypothetical protein
MLIWPKRPTIERISMQLTFEPARLTGFAILAVASATALSVGACSKSHDEKSSPTSSSAASSPAASNGKNKDSVHGQVASVSGNAVQVTESSGTATVDVGPSAKVTDYTKAQLTDVAAGNCVRVVSKPAPAPGGPATAISVQVSPPAGDGKCPQPKPAAAGSPGAPAPDQPFPVVGTVVSVEGNDIKVAVNDANGNPSQTDVTATDKTQYTKGVSADLQAVAQGKCITARGTKDGGGTLQATFITLTPANAKGQCPEPKQQPR